MRILLYGINYSPELTGIGKYSGEMARWLAGQGHDVRVICAPPYYPEWRIGEAHSRWLFKKQEEEGVTVIRCPLYVPAQPTAITRLLHLASFSLSSSVAVLAQLQWKPDVVVHVVPTLFCAPQALLLARLAGAQSVLHIQDYEVDALFGLGIASGGRLKRFAYAMERAILRAFGRVSTISSGMLRRAQQKGVTPEKLMFFPNWSETARFRKARRTPELQESLGIDAGKRVLLYAGNIGEKQGLESLIAAAAHFADRDDLRFLIVGEGAGKARLVEQARQQQLSNLVFAPLQPYEQLPALLASADCHLVIQKRGAADAVLPSKLTNILAVGGNAVITADPDTSLGVLCEQHPGIAICVEPESVAALIAGIEASLAMNAPNAVAQNYATQYLDKDQILRRFAAELGLGLPEGTEIPAVTGAYTRDTEIPLDALLRQRLLNLASAIAERANEIALNLAMEAATAAEAGEALSADVSALTELVQRTVMDIEQLPSHASGTPQQIAQTGQLATEVAEIALLIDRIVIRLRGTDATAAFNTASAARQSNVIAFPSPRISNATSELQRLADELNELTASTAR